MYIPLSSPSNKADNLADNHKPDTTSSTSLHLQPSSSKSYDMTLDSGSPDSSYTYSGMRTSNDGQYVLIFDPAKKHFVLHRLDSSFAMNMTDAPITEEDASTYPQLSPRARPQASSTSAPQRRVSKVKPAKKNTSTPTAKTEAAKRKDSKVKKAKTAPVREPTPDEASASEDGDDLLIEYPDGPSNYQTSTTPIFQRRISEASDADEDAEGEEWDEPEEMGGVERNGDVDLLQLPSPAGNANGGMSDEEMELDLEAELEQALKANANANGNESDESEEE